MRKIAHPGCECSIGDELNSLSLLAGTPCVVQQYMGAGCSQKAVLRSVGDNGGPAPVTAARTLCIQKVRGKQTWWQARDEYRHASVTRMACQRLYEIFQSLPASGVHFHDTVESNFFYAPPRRHDAKVPFCPVQIIDLPQYDWNCSAWLSRRQRPKRRFPSWHKNFASVMMKVGCSPLD